MKNLLFSFENLSAKDTGVKKALQQFQRAGARVAQAEAMTGLKRSSGVTYRELHLTFTDSQRVVLRIKQTGDIFQVLLNGSALPIKNQDDHVAAVAEIAKTMDAGRLKFQRKLAAIKVRPPAGIRTAAPRMEQVLIQKRDMLKEAIAEVREEIDRARATNAAPPLAAAAAQAWELPMGAWIEQQLVTGRYADKYAKDAAARKQRADRLQIEWMEALTERAAKGRISDDSLDDLVDRMGEGALRMFRGVREPGVEGYRLPDLR